MLIRWPVLLIIIGYNALATDAVITVSGRVVPLPCTVDTNELTLDLGNIYASTLSKPGSYSDWVNGTISLSNCPALTQGITATFSGVKGSYYYRNQGTAKDIELHLQTKEGVDLNNGRQQPITITPQRSAQLPVRVRVFSSAGRAVEGTIVATITVTYTYQ